MGELADLGVLLTELVASGGIIGRLERLEKGQERIMSTLDDLKQLAQSIATLEQNIQTQLGNDSQYQSQIADLKSQLAAAADQHTADQATIAAGAAADTSADQQVQALQADVTTLEQEVASALGGGTPGGGTTTTAAAPTVTGVSPATGTDAGGDTVTVTGTGFFAGGSAGAVSAVNFGTAAATNVSVDSDTSLTATSPSGADGAVDVTVVTSAGTSATSASDQFTFDPAAPPPPPPADVPTVTGVSPSTGSDAGGDTVTITGTGFTGAVAVNFGSVPAASFSVTDDSDISAVTPAGADGTVDVSVVTPGGTSAPSASDDFTFGPASTPPGGGTTTTGTVTLSDPNATPAPAGTFPPTQLVAQVPDGTVPVVLPADATAVEAGSLDANALVVPVTVS